MYEMIKDGIVRSETCRAMSKECFRRSKCRTPRANCVKLHLWLRYHSVDQLHRQPEKYYLNWSLEIEAEVRRMEELK